MSLFRVLPTSLLRMTHTRSLYRQLPYDNNKQPWNERDALRAFVARIGRKETENMDRRHDKLFLRRLEM